jgi:hypothetical protein
MSYMRDAGGRRLDSLHVATQRTELTYDPAGKSNGALAASFAADTGQAMTAFTHTSPSSAPLSVSSGVIVHTPTGSSSAGYVQANLGARVRRIGCMVSWPTGALGQLSLVIPSAPWAHDTQPNAGFHLTVFGHGLWTLSRYTSGGLTFIAGHSTNGRFNANNRGLGFKPIDVFISPEDQRCVITWPDGSTAVVTSAFFASETSNYAVWALNETGGSADAAAQIGAVWADTAPTTPDASALTPYRRTGVRAPVPASVSGSVGLDLARGAAFILTLTGNVTLLNFSNIDTQQNGQDVEVQFIQDATGGRKLSGVDTGFKFADNLTPVLSGAANSRDTFRFKIIDGQLIEVARDMGGATVTHPAAWPLDIVVLAGQSNATQFGSLPATIEPAVEDVVEWNGSAFIQASGTPWLGSGFARRYAEIHGRPERRRVAVVKAGLGSTGFSSLNPGTWDRTVTTGATAYLYPDMIAKAQAALAAAPAGSRIIGVIWSQGEQDAGVGLATYQAKLDDLIAQTRIDLAVSDLPFIIGSLTPELVATGAVGYGSINNILEDTPRRVVRTSFVPGPKNMADVVGSGIHWNPMGQRIRGRVMAESGYNTALLNSASAVPLPPVNLRVTRSGDAAVIEWDHPETRVTSYTIQTCIDSGTTWVTETLTAVTTHTHTVNVSAGTPLWVRGSSTNEVGASFTSLEVHA